ncbi:extracellular solute-binding protein family 1 [Beutenbergia cavernae DSM 12333]|uniref:Extracellular solute-binding protein family 1 n=1 Tax=Beutenbergia cavernae (strain ATCC BAA-8 / DSM 12333 / CCUG 43141 / JCM 11478 / NBRC 16432 / NCIMB 13614 / HKI 0122) TaxID=471853 RepID=C5BV18_BEUC1|nr:extracellular solute-binding protein [Beutenbergia cavernae]ACQ78392.1 extracellular solute-binding protein family 1 [Beutenbergia cavernae DSM 12333]
MRFTTRGALAVGAVLALGLAACSSGDPDAGEGGQTQIVIWDAGLLTKSTEDGEIIEESSFLTQAVAMYEEEHPDIDIEVVQTTGDISATAAQFQAASIAGDGPDIRTSFTGGNTISFAEFLLDLDGTFDDATVDDLSGWNTVREGYAEDGALLGMPYGGGSYFYVFYNKELAEQAGLDLSEPPATWEDLLDVGQQVQDSGVEAAPFWIANLEGYVGAWVIAALVGGELGSDAFTQMYNQEIAVDDDAMVRAYEAYAELYSRGLTNPDAGSVSNGDASLGFVQGDGVFYISGGWENASLTEAMGDNIGVFPIPVLEGAEYPNTAAGGPNIAISITNYSEVQEEAKDFLRFLAEPEMIDLYVELFQVEASNSASADPSVITNPLLQTQAEMLVDADAVVFPFDNVMPQGLIDLFYRVNATTFLGTTTPEDAVGQLQDLASTELG